MRFSVYFPALASLLLPLASPLAGPLEVSFFPSTTKVAKLGKDLPQGSDQLKLELARNEYEAFQVMVRSEGPTVADVALEVSDLIGPEGAVLPASQVSLYLEYYVEITFASPCDVFFSKRCDLFPIYQREVGWYPDALIPFFDPYDDAHKPVAVPFQVAENDFQMVFVEVYAPIDQKPGSYTGTVTLMVEGTAAASLPLEVEIWDFAIPVKRNVATAYRFSPSSADDYHGGPDGINTDEERLIYRNYEWEVHRHRIDATNLFGEVEYKFDEQGNLLPIDWTKFEARVAPRLDGSYYPDGAGANRFDFDTFSPGRGLDGMTPEQYVQAAKATAEFLQSKDWLKHIYLYASDEPWMPEHRANGSYDRIKSDSELLHSETDLWKGHVMVTGPWIEQLDPYVDIWCPVTPMYGHNYWPKGTWPEPDFYKDLMEKGKELWFYVCNANFPGQMGYDVDTKIGYEPRLVKWGAWYEGATGFLYWRLAYWRDEDPWHVLVNIPGFGELFSRQGDGILMYPGNHDGPLGTGSPEGVELDGPVISYRMKQIRDGLEDWEMFILAAQLGGEEFARKQVARAYSAFGAPLTDTFDINNPPWTLDEQVLLDARRQVALKVQYLTSPDIYPDPEAPVVVEEPVEPNPESTTLDVVAQDATATDSVASDLSSDAISDVGPQVEKKSGGCAASTSSPSALALILVFFGLVRMVRRQRKS